MHEKRRYILFSVNSPIDVYYLEKILFETVNRLDKTLSIRSNFKLIKDIFINKGGDTLSVISVNNKYKYDVTFKNSGSLKKIKEWIKQYGTISQ